MPQWLARVSAAGFSPKGVCRAAGIIRLEGAAEAARVRAGLEHVIHEWAGRRLISPMYLLQPGEPEVMILYSPKGINDTPTDSYELVQGPKTARLPSLEATLGEILKRVRPAPAPSADVDF